METRLFLTAAILSLSLVSCDKGGDDPILPGATTEGYIDATASTTWHYYSFSEKKVVGSADESAENNAVWAARTDWDIAVRRYNIRTNSGASTTTGAQGGVYVFDADDTDEFGNVDVTTAFASVLNVPAAAFAADRAFPSDMMTGGTTGGTSTVVRSEAVVVQVWRNGNAATGGYVMPADYRSAPVCVFRSADGGNYYKVQFTQYKNDEAVTGHVKFYAAQIYK
jgi:hypothetical protein